MKKILLPTDFSDNSWNAIVYALNLYKNEECNFTLLHTYTPVYYQMDFMEPSSTAFKVSEILQEVSEEKLDKLQEKITSSFKNSKHSFTQQLSFNTLTDEINSLCEESAMDVIIMGTKGASGVKGILFGSNTIHVLNKVKCPIIAVPSEFEFESPHEILFPTDLEISFNNHQLTVLKTIVEQNHARLNALHVSTGYDLTELQKSNMEQLESIFKNDAFLFHNEKTMNVVDAINAFQIKHKINLLVMVNNKHSLFENLFFKSTIKQIGFHLNIPFLVIPSKK